MISKGPENHHVNSYVEISSEWTPEFTGSINITRRETSRHSVQPPFQDLICVHCSIVATKTYVALKKKSLSYFFFITI